ncbi:YARHG domain-containing protein [Dolichospermum sp. ST_con]|nr:YARHG domain-containing protein [Dolichospermum sp. ST_con]MDD1418710.1 YARHG domain-containing protein [Dolichospermum sp. ST_sed1]MDD1425550.1 YARHG domain-containing protein [Dolichospermum sp. ST_sed9]MDD1430687.1 YARHG domain-containing protein [Dolichospermum sp. ST_sed6]MDD1440183.1 YARHG domain-containing protein [Dolichospermum sp. ST_sed3]MDD1446277.1 YARHG domain-containing protein [Dolichospermum sp. ST_sed8]MDD1454205.1 YARHG domain-containing protein [Dolichospermum sp. ST_se
MLLNNRYRIIKTLGSGGFGETYLAEDTQMPSQRRCVIKQLKPIQHNTQIYQLVQERFQREAAILEELGSISDQIPSLYAYFQFNDQFYLVQELIEGDTVTEKIQQHGILTENAVRKILLSLLLVLEYVHSKRIIHRDIKPDNIILRHHDGKPVLIDFGAVRESMGTVVNSQGNPTSSIVIGTPGFMPSEQASGRPVYSSDLYSLGLTAIYLLTGKIPQELLTEPNLGNILWRHFAPYLSPNFADILDKAIAYHPKEHFTSAREMLEALQTLSNPVVPAFVPTPTVIGSPSPLSLENTIAVSPGNNLQNSHQTNQNTARGGIILASIIASGLIGASIIIGFAINKSPLPIESSNNKNTSVSSSTTQENQKTALSKNIHNTINHESPLPQSSIKTETKNQQLSDSSTLNNSIYFVADSAFSDLQPATKQAENLQVKGYSQAGIFWIPDYPNLSGKPLYEVYANRFSDLTNCINFLKTYGKVNSDSYCVLASKDANTSPNRVFFKEISNVSISNTSPINTTNANTNNYFWISQRRVTEADLAGKDGYELDIMRNTVFAVNGRRFDTPGLQEYFNQQSWYNPRYLPKQFPVSLLSKLEQQNVEYIAKYQDRNNLRHFKK